METIGKSTPVSLYFHHLLHCKAFSISFSILLNFERRTINISEHKFPPIKYHCSSVENFQKRRRVIEVITTHSEFVSNNTINNRAFCVLEMLSYHNCDNHLFHVFYKPLHFLEKSSSFSFDVYDIRWSMYFEIICH